MAMNKPQLSPLTNLIEPGIYQHYKGGRYLVLGAAYIEATLEKVVVYKQYGESGSEAIMFVRPFAEFIQRVESDSGAVPRFTFISKSE